MSWIIRWDGTETSSDDFTIEDLGSVERATGIPWSIANALKDVSVARAFLAVAMLRQGMSEREVADALNAVTLKTLKNAFEWRADEESEGEDEEPDPSDRRPPPTSPSSSPGGRGKGGRPASRASKGSGTSS